MTFLLDKISTLENYLIYDFMIDCIIHGDGYIYSRLCIFLAGTLTIL